MTPAKTCGRTRKLCLPKAEAKTRQDQVSALTRWHVSFGPSNVKLLGMWWERRRLYATPVRKVEHFGEHLGAAKAGRSNS